MRPELPDYGAASGSLRVDAERFGVVRAQIAPANRSVVPARGQPRGRGLVSAQGDIYLGQVRALWGDVVSPGAVDGWDGGDASGT